MDLREATAHGRLLGYDARQPNDEFHSSPSIRTLDYNLWSSASGENTLVSSLHEILHFQEDFIIIAVVRWSVDERLASHDAELPAEPDAWKFLGFDITDETLISGLHNCTLVDEEHWLFSSLNESRLIPTFDLAQRFRRECDREAPEHAPFFVNGVWILPT